MAETRIGQRKFGTREERRAYWRGHVEAWSESEQSKQGYCRAHGLNPASFYRWQGKLNGVAKETPGFIPVRVPMKSPTYPIEVTLSHGVVLRLGNEADGALLTQLLRELGRGC